MMEIILTLYIVRVIACICALAVMDKWELENNGIGTKTKAVLFAFMPFYLFYLVGKRINKKFEK